MKLDFVRKVTSKIKQIGKKIFIAIKEANKRRAERAMSHELGHYYWREYRNDAYMKNFPYHMNNRRD